MSHFLGDSEPRALAPPPSGGSEHPGVIVGGHSTERRAMRRNQVDRIKALLSEWMVVVLLCHGHGVRGPGHTEAQPVVGCMEETPV